MPLAAPDSFFSRSDTFTAAGNGVTVNASDRPINSFAIQVVGTGASATAWTVVLEGSLDGTNFTAMLTHNTVTGNGTVLFSGANLFPVNYFRSRCVSVTLGSATNIVVYVLGL